MVYLEYEFQKAKFHEVQRVFNELLNEKERLFTKTQPKAITYDGDRVQGGEHANVLDDYVIPHYDTLHTLGQEYLVEDISDFVKEREAAGR